MSKVALWFKYQTNEDFCVSEAIIIKILIKQKLYEKREENRSVALNDASQIIYQRNWIKSCFKSEAFDSDFLKVNKFLNSQNIYI